MMQEPKNPVHKPTLWLAAGAFMFAFIPIIIITIWPPWQQPTICSASLCQQTIAVRSQAFTVGATSLTELSANCEQDEVVTGGGFSVVDDPNLNVWKNSPTTSDRSWGVGVSNYGSISRSGTVFAVCIRVQ